MNKSIKRFSLILITAVIIAISLFTATFAWLNIGENDIRHNIYQASIIQQYFHTGEGTEENPYVITRPIHYYHLVELYQRTKGFADQKYYFQLGYEFGNGYQVYAYDNNGNIILDEVGNPTYSDTLNMAYYSGNLALLPIGTSSVPFDGTFNGNNLTVANLNIKASEEISSTLTLKTSDIGIFGYVGEGGFVKNVYYENVSIDLSSLEAGVDINSNMTTLTHTSHENANDVYVGYLVGHLHVIRLKNETTYDTDNLFENVYVNSCTILGAPKSGDHVNSFGYIGGVDVTGEETSSKIQAAIDEAHHSGSAGNNEIGYSTTWGGSLAMYDLYERIFAILSDSNTTSRLATITYPVEQSVIYDEVKDEYIQNEVTRTASMSNISIRAYTYGVSTYEGSYLFYDRANIGQDQWIYLSGQRSMNEDEMLLTITTLTYLRDPNNTSQYLMENQLILHSGKNCLSINKDTKAIETVQSNDIVKSNAAQIYAEYLQNQDASATDLDTLTKLVIDSEGHIFTRLSGVKYYLELNGLKVSFKNRDNSQPTTVWTYESSTGEFFSEIGGVRYYLVNGDSLFGSGTGWIVLPNASIIHVGSSDGKYMKITSNGADITSTTNSSDATKFLLDTTAGTLYTYYDGAMKYVTMTYRNNSYSLSLSTSSNIKWGISNGKIVFYVPNFDNTAFYTNAYHPTFENSIWVGKTDYYYAISAPALMDGSYLGYIQISGTSVVAVNSQASASYFYFNTREGTPGTNGWKGEANILIDNTLYYLTLASSNGGTVSLTVSNNSKTKLVFTGRTLSCEDHVGLCLYCDGSTWKVTDSGDNKGFFIYHNDGNDSFSNWSGNGTHMSVNSSGSLVVTDVNGDYGWFYIGEDNKTDIGYVYTVTPEGKVYFLKNVGANTSMAVTTDASQAVSMWYRLGTGRRTLYYKFTNSGTRKYTTLYYDSSSWRTSSSAITYKSDSKRVTTTNGSVVYLKSSSSSHPTVAYSELSIDAQKMALTNLGQVQAIDLKIEIKYAGLQTYFPLICKATNEEDPAYEADTSLTTYAASSRNNGYVVSGGYDTTEGGVFGTTKRYSDIRLSTYRMNYLSTALNVSNSLFASDITYNDTYDSQLEVLTQTYKSGGVKRITDSHNIAHSSVSSSISSISAMTWNDLGLLSYESANPTENRARNNLKDMLVSGGTNLYGLHFMDTIIHINRTIMATNVSIFGEKYQYYELPEDSIDFNVQSAGSINFFAGTYFDNNNSFFSLHKIYRNDLRKITAIKEILYVYQSTTNKDAAYIYVFTDGTRTDVDGETLTNGSVPSGYQLVFDTTWITNPSNIVEDALYYFEIPCNAGEYALGAVYGKIGAYLLYLDIGTNGTAGGDTGMVVDNGKKPTVVVSDQPLFEDIDYRVAPNTLENHNSILNFTYTLPEGANASNFAIKVEYGDASERGDYADISEFCSGVYTFYITNTTGKLFDIYILLSDDDNDPTNDFTYCYEVYVNGTLMTNNESSVSGYSGSLRRWSKKYTVSTILS